MPVWAPTSETWYVVPIASGSVVVLLEGALRSQVTRVSVDVMEWCNLGSMRDSAKNIWTNLAVTAALVLTMGSAMLEVDKIEPRFPLEDDYHDLYDNVQSAYALHCGFAVLYCIVALLQCVIFLCYVNPLSNKDTIKFFIANPASIGGPVLSTIFGCVQCLIAMLIWVVGTVGSVHTSILSFFALVVVVFLSWDLYDKATFDPAGSTRKASEWQWAERPPEEWPWFVAFAKCDKGERVFRRLGAAIRDEVQPEGNSDAAAPGNPEAASEEAGAQEPSCSTGVVAAEGFHEQSV